MGRRFREAKDVCVNLERINIDENLEKARIIFKEMGLVEDVEDLNIELTRR